MRQDTEIHIRQAIGLHLRQAKTQPEHTGRIAQKGGIFVIARNTVVQDAGHWRDRLSSCPYHCRAQQHAATLVSGAPAGLQPECLRPPFETTIRESEKENN